VEPVFPVHNALGRVTCGESLTRCWPDLAGRLGLDGKRTYTLRYMNRRSDGSGTALTMDEDTRRIIHVDMDAFCAQIEQRDFPNQYAGEPIAVGGTPPRGVVQTASYEARPYGVHSAQPAVEAERKCPDLIFVPPRMDGYQQEARRIREVLRRYTDVVEPLSSDEVYLDVTDPKQGPSSGTLIARRIREEIYEKTNLTASAGAEQVRRESCFRPGQARRADNHRADRPARVYRGSFR